MNENDPGVRGRSLLLLGALSALALNPPARRRLMEGARDLYGTAQEVLDATVKPALVSAASQAGHAAQMVTHKGAETLGTLREEVPTRTQAPVQAAQHVAKVTTHKSAETLETLREQVPARAQSLLEGAREVAGTAAGAVGAKAAELTREVRHTAKEARKQVADRRQEAERAARRRQREAKKAGQAGQALASRAETEVGGWLREAGGSFESRRRDAERLLYRARRGAEKELQARKRDWDAEQFELALARKVAPVQKQTARELARLNQQARKQRRALEAQRRAEAHGGWVGGLLTLALVGTGAAVLARVPAARQAILKAAGSVSPEAAERLHRASRQARNIVGTMWLEPLEEAPKPVALAPAPAAGTQAGTSGATWGSSPAPGTAAANDSAAASRADNQPGPANKPN